MRSPRTATKSSPCLQQLEKDWAQQQRLSAAKNKFIFKKIKIPGTSLTVQWLRLHAPTAVGPGCILGQGTRSRVHAATKDPEPTQPNKYLFLKIPWTSQVVQWLRIRLPMQGTRVRALVWEDPTCCGATKPMRQNY